MIHNIHIQRDRAPTSRAAPCGTAFGKRLAAVAATTRHEQSVAAKQVIGIAAGQVSPTIRAAKKHLTDSIFLANRR